MAAYEAARRSGSDDWAFGDEAGARADPALARASLGEIEGTAEALEPVLNLPQDQRITGILGSVARVQIALRAPEYVGSAAVNRLRASHRRLRANPGRAHHGLAFAHVSSRNHR
ncbi:hypothetical protein GCM10027294_13280 [Marinactinospora endophytica]